MNKMMITAALALAVVATPSIAQRGGSHGGGRSFGTGAHYTAPHVTKSGTYVQGHMATNPNSTRNDNYSTRGNTNPYTGKAGTKPRDGESY